MRHRGSRLTPFSALRARPGGGWGAAGATPAEPLGPSTSSPHPITSEARTSLENAILDAYQRYMANLSAEEEHGRLQPG